MQAFSNISFDKAKKVKKRRLFQLLRKKRNYIGTNLFTELLKSISFTKI